MESQIIDYGCIMIPTYILQNKESTDNINHILKEFKDRPEFDICFIEACNYKNAAIGLWSSIVKIVQLAVMNDDDVIIICSDKHEFTEHYSKIYMLKNIIEANDQGAWMLCGGVEQFDYAVPLTYNRMWISLFQSTQFIVLFKRIFENIVNYDFKIEDAVDSVLSEMTSHKMVFFPYISQQKKNECTDSIDLNNQVSTAEQNLLKRAVPRLALIQQIYLKYRSDID